MKSTSYKVMSLLFKIAILFFITVSFAWSYDELLRKAIKAYDESRFPDVVKIISKALELKENPQYYLLRGLAYSKMEEFDLAVADFTSTIKLSPHSLMGYYQRGKAYKELGKLDLALKDVNQALELAPNNVEIYKIRSEIYIAMGLKEKAREDFAKILEAMGLKEKAREDFAKILEIIPYDYATLMHMADGFLSTSETTQAIIVLSKAIKTDSTKWEAFCKRGYLYYTQQKNNLAFSDFSKALGLVSINLENAQNLANWFASKKLYDWAIKVYILLEKAYPKDPNPTVNKGYAYFYLGQYDLAISEFTKAISKFLTKGDLKNAAEICFRRGEINYKLGNFSLANADFMRAKQLAPNTEFEWKLIKPTDFSSQETEKMTGTFQKIEKVTEKETLEVKPTTETKAAEKRESSLSAEKIPKLIFDYLIKDSNNDKILDGGEKIVLKVTVKNQGEGDAQGVKVLLSGGSKALNYLGKEKYIGDIPPGGEKEAVFEAILPYRIEPDNANLIIKVTEANGFDALKEAELLIAMQPAKVEREREIISVLVDVDQPLSPASFRREDAYAVIIGISDYRSNKIPKVKYAKRDAEIMKDYLINVCGIPEENIISLTDEKATLSDLTAYIEEWLQRNVNKNSFVFVYFAGHGTPNPEKGDAYLVPYDGEPGFISKLYPLSRFYNSLENLPTENIVVALDACFSGAGGRSVIEEGKRPFISPKIEKVGKKAVVLTASGSDEISQDLDTKRHGLFTYYILKGLRGEADLNGDGWITLGELYNYCQPKVRDESRRLGYAQTPKVFPEPLGEKANLKIGKVR